LIGGITLYCVLAFLLRNIFFFYSSRCPSKSWCCFPLRCPSRSGHGGVTISQQCFL